MIKLSTQPYTYIFSVRVKTIWFSSSDLFIYSYSLLSSGELALCSYEKHSNNWASPKLEV